MQLKRTIRRSISEDIPGTEPNEQIQQQPRNETKQQQQQHGSKKHRFFQNNNPIKKKKNTFEIVHNI